MTKNQIDYMNGQEQMRHNRAVELETFRNNNLVIAETNRHNVVTEVETMRHNVSDENIRHEANLINNLHYQRMDAETQRHNVAVENETNRHNVQSENAAFESNRIGWANVTVAKQNAATNAMNAATNRMQAETAQFDAKNKAVQYESSYLNAVSNSQVNSAKVANLNAQTRYQNDSNALRPITEATNIFETLGLGSVLAQ